MCVIFVVILAGGASPPRRRDSEADLLARLQREQNPVKKAKIEIRLARLKLLRGLDACQKDDHEQCQQGLSTYFDLISSSWQRLKSSGRQAVRQPQGFKELDIALREDLRRLEDLKRGVPFADRGEVEKTSEEIEKIRNEVLKALFPGERPKGAQNDPVGLPRPHFMIGKVAG